jgi:fucose 4-O-acetylase-like acetyltransferase
MNADSLLYVVNSVFIGGMLCGIYVLSFFGSRRVFTAKVREVLRLVIVSQFWYSWLVFFYGLKYSALDGLVSVFYIGSMAMAAVFFSVAWFLNRQAEPKKRKDEPKK